MEEKHYTFGEKWETLLNAKSNEVKQTVIPLLLYASLIEKKEEMLAMPLPSWRF